MATIPASRSPDGFGGPGVLAVGFGTAVTMWGVGYLGRLPAVLLPAPALLVLMLVCLVGGGFVVGRYANRGWRHGAAAGVVTGLLNLLVLGSFLGAGESGRVIPSAIWWLPGSILFAGVLAAAGAAAGTRWFRRSPPFAEWTASFAQVAVGATLLLLAVGGLVTSNDAGLAVADWPNSFGYNMFLYPFSRMTGGIYYEHAHRLFGALVGLTTVVLAALLQRTEPRRWVRRLGWLAVMLVIAQGMLGGLRVTGHLTLETAAAAMRPNLTLALIHGVLAQLFFGLVVAMAAFTSVGWRRGSGPLAKPGVRTERVMGGVLLGLMLFQLGLGAAQRHFDRLLMVHIAVGVAVVTPLALHVGFRAWGVHHDQPLLQRLGLGLVVAVGLQLLLGLGAVVVIRSETIEGAAEALVTTAHLWLGAVVLALGTLLFAWSFRLLQPVARGR